MDGLDLSKYNFVEQFYEMNPDTEDILFDGTELRDGMVVLIENDSSRENLGTVSLSGGAMLTKALVNNRWCTVSNIRIENSLVYFIAEYENGIKKKRWTSDTYAWYVKKDSIPKDKVEAPDKMRSEEAFGYVKSAFEEARRILRNAFDPRTENVNALLVDTFTDMDTYLRALGYLLGVDDTQMKPELKPIPKIKRFLLPGDIVSEMIRIVSEAIANPRSNDEDVDAEAVVSAIITTCRPKYTMHGLAKGTVKEMKGIIKEAVANTIPGNAEVGADEAVTSILELETYHTPERGIAEVVTVDEYLNTLRKKQA